MKTSKGNRVLEAPFQRLWKAAFFLEAEAAGILILGMLQEKTKVISWGLEPPGTKGAECRLGGEDGAPPGRRGGWPTHTRSGPLAFTGQGKAWLLSCCLRGTAQKRLLCPAPAFGQPPLPHHGHPSDLPDPGTMEASLRFWLLQLRSACRILSQDILIILNIGHWHSTFTIKLH